MNKNNIVYIVAALVALVALFFAFSGKKPDNESNNESSLESGEQSAEINEERDLNFSDGAYSLVNSGSYIVWEGRKPLLSNYKDKGTLALKSGSFNIQGGILTGGEIVIDMKSLVATEVAKGGTEGLTKHLRSADFFDVENFPEAKISLLEVLPSSNPSIGLYNVNAELTVKGISNAVEVPLDIYNENGKTIIAGSTELDRTLWNIRFGSDKFFDNLADNIIDDMFKVDFRFVGEQD